MPDPAEPPIGAIVRLRFSGLELRIGAVIGRGGQGAVFEAVTVSEDRPLAVKWYRPEIATREQLESVADLVRLGPPTSAFLWPLEICRSERIRGFGYVMPRLPRRFVTLDDLMAARVRTGFARLCEAGAQLADAFLALHSRGLCYRDISFGNVFVDPTSGDILVGDNDNVGIDGSSSPVLGTPYFIAPEVMRREANPSTSTDRHSLAVILFCLLVRHHPLLGSRESSRPVLDGDALRDLLGSAPRFIFDPVDDTNRPVAEDHPNAVLFWPLLPGVVQALFTRAFTTGLSDPASRVTEGEWTSALRQLRDLIRHCPRCGGDQFFDPDAPDPTPCVYPSCRLPLHPPLRLRSGTTTVVLELGRRLLPRHLSGWPDPGAVDPLGEVVRLPGTGLLGLRNDSGTTWVVVDEAGGRSPVPPAGTVPLRSGVVAEIDGALAHIDE